MKSAKRQDARTLQGLSPAWRKIYTFVTCDRLVDHPNYRQSCVPSRRVYDWRSVATRQIRVVFSLTGFILRVFEPARETMLTFLSSFFSLQYLCLIFFLSRQLTPTSTQHVLEVCPGCRRRRDFSHSRSKRRGPRRLPSQEPYFHLPTGGCHGRGDRR